MTDRYRHARARPLGYRVGRALLAVLIAIGALAVAIVVLIGIGYVALSIFLVIVG
jgi:hypothetical protein